MFLSEIFETFESERFLRSLEKFERFLRALGLFALQCCTINIDIIEWEGRLFELVGNQGCLRA